MHALSTSAAPTASDFAIGVQLSAPPEPVLQQQAIQQAVGGPTPADNAELSQFKASLAAPQAAPVDRGGPRGPSNPDPYGIGAAQKAQLGAFDARMGAMGRAATRKTRVCT